MWATEIASSLPTGWQMHTCEEMALLTCWAPTMEAIAESTPRTFTTSESQYRNWRRYLQVHLWGRGGLR